MRALQIPKRHHSTFVPRSLRSAEHWTRDMGSVSQAFLRSIYTFIKLLSYREGQHKAMWHQSRWRGKVKNGRALRFCLEDSLKWRGSCLIREVNGALDTGPWQCKDLMAYALPIYVIAITIIIWWIKIIRHQPSKMDQSQRVPGVKHRDLSLVPETMCHGGHFAQVVPWPQLNPLAM